MFVPIQIYLVFSDSHLIDEVRLHWTNIEPMQLRYGAVGDGSQITGGENGTCEWNYLSGMYNLVIQKRLFATPKESEMVEIKANVYLNLYER
jgi:hypothetical protein